MKNLDIIKRSIAGLLIAAVAVCAFGCSSQKSEKATKDKEKIEETEEVSLSCESIEKAFRDAAEEYGLEEYDWSKRYNTDTVPTGFTSIESGDDDAEQIFYGNVAAIFGSAPGDEMPEIRRISVFHLGSGKELIYANYVVFANEEDCEEYRDMFSDWFKVEKGEEKGYECYIRLLDGRMDAVYRDGNTLIWITDSFYKEADTTPVMLQYIYEKLDLKYPELKED